MSAPSNDLKPVYYIYGTDDFLAEEELKALKAAALTGGFASMNYHVFEGKNINASEAISAASTMPAFSQRRLVLIKGAESIKAAQEKDFFEYVKDPSPSTCLVFLADTARADRNSAFFKYLGDKGYLRQCNRLSERDLLSWIKKEVKKDGKAISDGAAQKLVSIAGNRLRDIKGELEKIILFTGEKTRIEDSDVEDVGVDLKEETIFGLSEAIGEKDVKKALKVFTKLSGEEPVKVLGAISRQIRVLLKLKALLRKKTPDAQAAGALGVPPYFIDKYKRSSRNFTEKELKGAIGRLSSADIDLKTGRVPAPVVLPRLITELCGGEAEFLSRFQQVAE